VTTILDLYDYMILPFTRHYDPSVSYPEMLKSDFSCKKFNKIIQSSLCPKQEDID